MKPSFFLKGGVLLLILFRSFFKGIFFLCFILVCACESSLRLPSFSAEKLQSRQLLQNFDFLKFRQAQDSDRLKVLEQSQNNYKESGFCSSASSCRKICSQLFSLSWDEENCKKLPALQVYRFESLYNRLLDKKLTSLQKISVFDLKIFLNLSPEPFLRFIQTLGPIPTKIFLQWITNDWQIAKIFVEEDWDFLFLDIFLNEIQVSPIDSLKEELAEGRTFMELAWFKAK